MRAQRLHIERVVPIDHIVPHVKALLVVMSESCISICLDVVLVRAVIRTDDFLEFITLFEPQIREIYQLLEHALTTIILCHKLDELIDDPLKVGVGLVTNLAVSIEIHEQLHSFTLGQTCLTNESQEK